MKSWFEIVVPHSMIQSGIVKETFFVADLGDVVKGSAPPYYSNPRTFFQRTYLTKGLHNLLNDVHTKLFEKDGSGIVKLQTPFGGGKTHALISIFHYVTSGDDLKDFLPRNLSSLKTNVVTIVGTNLNPLEGRKDRNVCIHTLWGDIAYQIAGVSGYQEFEANDKNRISPGKDKIRDFLSKHEPFLIMFDEVVEYIAKARGISVNESNLGTQTLLFLQELTEAISSLTRGLLIITLPAHEHEDFSEIKLNTINRVNRILGRVETTETPIIREEVYQLVTKRLIKNVPRKEDRDEVISDYTQIYQKRRNDLPKKYQNFDFFERMRESYPFHPEIIDLLYDKWRSLPSFQGIRAILRILARTLIYLWSSKEQLDLILPLNIHLHMSPLKNDFLRHIDARFESIIDSDMIGKDSRAFSLDKEHPEWNKLASGVSQTIFLSSFTQSEPPRGITLSELKLAMITPEIPVSLITEILHQVHRTLHHLHLEDGRYYFSHEPNLNQKIQDIKDLFHENYEEEMRKEIKKHISKEFSTIIWPNSSNEIPDDRKLKIVFIRPFTPKNSFQSWLETTGTTFRRNKNTIIFAVPNDLHLRDFKDLVQTKLALKELQDRLTISQDIKNSKLNLEIKQRIKSIENALAYSVQKTYSILYDGKSTITLGLPRAEYEPLTKWYHRELYSREHIVTKLHYRKLIELFFGQKQHISSLQILDQFYINPELFKIESADVIQQTICWGVEEGAFGLVILKDNKLQMNSFFFSSTLIPSQVTFASEEYLLNKSIAEVISKKIASNPEINEATIPDEIEESSDLLFISTSETHTEPPKLHSLSIEVQNLNSKSLPSFYRGVLQPLESKNAEISLDIKLDVKSSQEIPESTINTTIKETISQLGARIIKFQRKK